MLYTNLHHILTAPEHHEIIGAHCQAVICYGRMDPCSVPVFQALELMAEAYPDVYFADMELGNPEVERIPDHPAGISYAGEPVTLFYRNGRVEYTVEGTVATAEIEKVLYKLNTNISNQ